MSQSAAYEALSRLAALSRSSAKGLPAHKDVAPRWSGIGFTTLGFKFVVPMGQISEMMDVPDSTMLPGVQPWVLGLANVRGRLLPLFDLAQYFGGQIGNQKRGYRILVIETDSLYSGLVVDRAFGMKHFTADSVGETKAELPASVTHFVRGAYEDSAGDEWGIFDFSLLAEDQRFTNVALL